VHQWLSRALDVKVTPNLQGAVWSKLLLNCSVTTIGAIAGLTMREYIDRPGGRELFYRTYDEALSVAFASGIRPDKMLVDPIPPGWNGRSISGEAAIAGNNHLHDIRHTKPRARERPLIVEIKRSEYMFPSESKEMEEWSKAPRSYEPGDERRRLSHAMLLKI
jgi:hypothetical protein